MSIQPKFTIGQKVVAKCNQPQGFFKKGSEFTIDGIRKGCCIPGFLVSIRVSNSHPWQCSICLKEYERGELFFDERFFDPIGETFQRITFEKIIDKEAVSVN
mgnify:FL=1